jgi:hypothetical protein
MHCELNFVVDSMLADPVTGQTAPELVAIREAMKNMKRANSGLTWIKQPHVRAFFEQVRGHRNVTHELLDSLPPSRTRDYVRGLLGRVSLVEVDGSDLVEACLVNASCQRRSGPGLSR